MKDKANIKQIVVFIVSFVWLYLGSSFGINIYDEGIAIMGSTRIAGGELPYIDFWTVYSPGWYFIQSWFIGIFGDSMETLRLFNTLINTLTVFVIFKTLQSQSIKPYFVSLTALMLISLSPAYARALPIAIFLIVLCVYILLNKSNKAAGIIAMSFITVIVFTIRHDFGVYLGAAVFVYQIFEIKIISRTNTYNNLLLFVSTSIALLSIFLLSLSFAGILDEYIDQAYIFVIHNFSATRSIPFPNPFAAAFNQDFSLSSKIFGFWESALFYLPFFNILLGLLLIKMKKLTIEHEGKLFLMSMLLSLFLITQGITRSDFEHILPSIIIGLPLLQIYIEKFEISNKYILFALLTTLSLPPIAKKAVAVKSANINPHYLRSEKASHISLQKELGSNYNDLIDFIRINCRDNYFYSGTLQHDVIHINDVMLYYLTNKKCPVKYHELHPGQATEEEIQIEIIESLEDKKVNWLVLYNSPIRENNISSVSSNAFFLDEYIEQYFMLNKIFGDYYVFRRVR